ncbi:MAG: RNA 2',3'-cyclic phosphodiesterase [Pseudomonadota bacterium]
MRRLFVGWMAGPAARESLAALQELLRPRFPRQGLRWVAPADLHVTLWFLGELLYEREQRVAAALSMFAAGVRPVAAHTAALRWWPSTAAPRVMVLQVDSHGALERVAAALEPVLRNAGVEPQCRRFRAHLTLARVVDPCAPVTDPGDCMPHVPLPMGRLSLVDSAARDDGTRYRELAGWPLAGGRGVV